VRGWFSRDLIEDVWAVDEWAFDAAALGQRMTRELEAAGVDVRYRNEAISVSRSDAADGRLDLVLRDDAGDEGTLRADWVFNCTYANLNALLSASGLQKIALKQELAEMALVEVPDEFARVGVTVMCGPFFSFMPFPSRGLHTFSHVRYTPHHAWFDREVDHSNLEYFDQVAKRSNYLQMRLDSARYMPLIGDFVQRDSLWELKAILPQSEADDSRPILFRRDTVLPGLVSVLGGKIDNVYDLEHELAETLAAAHGRTGA
jgi:glycine/D-amino acid oxidase-like deaminating enzyme